MKKAVFLLLSVSGGFVRAQIFKLIELFQSFARRKVVGIQMFKKLRQFRFDGNNFLFGA